ncbi:alpha/beta hydrolase [Marivita hallyeonensis]|uniref:Serine aminopeptidase, S33 n=1 Tax=Marivita hallyeonensis TaxID=996342 RepID=A0A1M5XBZ7_9RHOB|nr:alpha/beta hydrolase [Marivita hallyeonensis]SHH97044.1 Serine aminopeptidase, S33 [Marivita hallyeonensis]
MIRPFLTVLTLLIGLVGVFVLESARSGVAFDVTSVGNTPVTTLAQDGANGPHVVVAHGFAGSREMMQGYGLVLAQAGYRVHMFDFEGHGAHPLPMSGDVNLIEGTTMRLVDQTLAVIDAVQDGEQPVALLGHSMATDVLVRVAEISDRTGPLVLLSAFSQAVTDKHPANMLLISGQWEPPLRDFGLRAARMVDADADEGEVVTSEGVIRATKVAPHVEHVAILQSREGRADALAWLNRAYVRDATVAVPPTGWAFLAVMAAITALAGPLARLLVHKDDLPPKPVLPTWKFALVIGGPMVLTPLLATLIDIDALPVLVADYLAVHLGLYGITGLILLRWLTGAVPVNRVNLIGFTGLLVWGLGVFGFALDRYGANFFPVAERLPIIAALALGAVPFMVADAAIAWRASIWKRIASRVALLISLGIAVTLDFESLFFLVMIAPVIVLFFLVHGTMGRAFAKQTGPLTAGLALGLILAWALGVSFPMFSV